MPHHPLILPLSLSTSHTSLEAATGVEQENDDSDNPLVRDVVKVMRLGKKN
jgi:hypothetical protein